MADDPGEISALLAGAAAGDQSAWDEIVRRYTNLLWSVGRAHRLQTAQIADVIQVTWLRLLENLTSIREPDKLAGWLATTARRECLQVIRRSGREVNGWDSDMFNGVVDENAPPVGSSMLDAERDSSLWRCFARLSERCQRLLRVLMAVDSGSYREVSQAMGLPIGSIGPTRMRCLEQLRAIMAGSGYPFNAAFGTHS